MARPLLLHARTTLLEVAMKAQDFWFASASLLLACSGPNTSPSDTDGGPDSASAGAAATCADVCNNLQAVCPQAYTSDCVSTCSQATPSSAQLNCGAQATSCADVAACRTSDGGTTSDTGTTITTFGSACVCSSPKHSAGNPGTCSADCGNEDLCVITPSGAPNDGICTHGCQGANSCPGNYTCDDLSDGLTGDDGYFCMPAQ